MPRSRALSANGFIQLVGDKWEELPSVDAIGDVMDKAMAEEKRPIQENQATVDFQPDKNNWVDRS
jgi:hypothetical protein